MLLCSKLLLLANGYKPFQV